MVPIDSGIPTRAAYSEALIELGSTDPNVVALDADVAKSVGSAKFHKQFPGKAFNLGVAEQNTMGYAAGLASCGKTVFVSTYAVFATMRACEQVRTFIAYPRLNVKIGASHGGLHTGMDGVTHQGIEDVGIMRSIPGITILSPSDAYAAYHLTLRAAEWDGPVYLRLARNPVPPVHVALDGFLPEIGHPVVVRDVGAGAADVAIVATGVMVSRAVRAAEALGSQGIGARVVECHTIRPIDADALLDLTCGVRGIVTAEDHNINGGLGSAVCELVCERRPGPVVRVGVRDVFGESGDPDVLLDHYGMAVDDLVGAATWLSEWPRTAGRWGTDRDKVRWLTQRD